MKQAVEPVDAGTRKARMVDIAREAGVSLATVDRVLNGRDGVNAETASRVQAVVQRLNYAPNLAASLLSRGRILQFDIVLPAGSNTFIRDLGAAYRATHRDRPLMDAFAFHPYMEASRFSPTGRHPENTTITIADYPKLVALLGEAFDGTAQPGQRLPIYYTEFGVQTRVPSNASPSNATSFG